MLVFLAKLLNLVDDFFIYCTLDGNDYCQPTHRECCDRIIVLCHSLQIGHVQRARRLVQHVGEVLRHEPVQPFERAEAEDPVLGRLGGWPCGLSEVLCIAGWCTLRISTALVNTNAGCTHTRPRTSKNTAPSQRSEMVATGRTKLKVARKEMKAVSSLRCVSAMVCLRSADEARGAV